MIRTPVLSLMFAPANRGEFLIKFGAIPAGAFAIDLEDGLPPAERPAVRENLGEIYRTARFHAAADARIFLRINSPDTSDYAEDCRTAAVAGWDGILLPKAEKGCAVAETAQRCGLPVMAGIESIEGLYAIDAICASASAGVFFGAEDFIAELGGVRTPSSAEVAYPRAIVAIAAKRAGVEALDFVTVDVRNDEQCIADAIAGKAQGYSGKMCIHPRQVALVNAAFRPDESAVEAAQRIVDGHERALAEGHATCVVDGRMIDEPLVRQAQAILAAAEV